MDETNSLLEELGRSAEEIEAAAENPAVQYQLKVLQATKEAREAGIPYVALEYQLMEILHGLYGLAIEAGELGEDDLLGELDEQTLHLLDVIGSSRRGLHQGLDEETVRENLETALESFDDDEVLEPFY
ncbi:hypothetical protein [Natronobiforma cellulositropha]|uniref:hypothetical protein n=1 Tax=Natronobiforma cellulositropha TaxID=1679076 RepID=UPI0021D5751B|nr:hypothetical protein [Natronobiforma cellulositropha]